MGWRLDVPSIERKPLSGWPTYDDAKDRFAFNGQALVFLCTIGQSTCPREEIFPDLARGWRYYRTQVEGGFGRFFLKPGGATWVVQHKGGRMQIFGIWQPTLGMPSFQNGTDRETPTQIFRWKLVVDIDSHGNTAVYRWRNLGAHRLSYLTDIYDTSRLDRRPEALTADDYAHHTRLWWEPSGLRVTDYTHVDHASPDLRLARIAVASTPWSGSGSREVIRAYALSYLDPRGAAGYVPDVQAPLWGHSFLKSVQMEGRCNRFEVNGDIPFVTGCAQLPATKFDYQSGALVLGRVTGLSRVNGAPRDADDSNFKLLSDTRTAAILDINRDGLPDVVQSWPANRVIDLNLFPDLRAQYALLNRGSSDTVSLRFQHQCIDAGTALGGLALHNLLQPAAFLSPGRGASVLGSWADSLLLWSQIDYGAVAITPVPAEASFCPAVAANPPEPNHPAWAWIPRSELGWLRSANSPGGNQPDKRWFADVDGDGYPDQFDRAIGPAPQDLELARVDFTRRLTGSASPTGKPALVPFVPNFSAAADSLAPGSAPRSDTRFFVVDINADGLADLVLYNPNDNGGIPRVRFGDGRGVFACVNGRQPEAARSVTRSNSALQSRGLGKTVVHSENGRFVVTISAARSVRSEITWKRNSAPTSASGT